MNKEEIAKALKKVGENMIVKLGTQLQVLVDAQKAELERSLNAVLEVVEKSEGDNPA